MQASLKMIKKLDYVGDAPDLLNKIVGQLREEGKWDE